MRAVRCPKSMALGGGAGVDCPVYCVACGGRGWAWEDGVKPETCVESTPWRPFACGRSKLCDACPHREKMRIKSDDG